MADEAKPEAPNRTAPDRLWLSLTVEYEPYGHKAPEREWIACNYDGGEYVPYIRYIRADIADGLAEALRACKAIASDRCAGGGMITPRDAALAAFDAARYALNTYDVAGKTAVQVAKAEGRTP
jgi:hypothetical protein